MLSTRQGEDSLYPVLPLGLLFLGRPCYWVHTYKPALMENRKFEARDASKSEPVSASKRKKDEGKKEGWVEEGKKQGGKIFNLFF